MEKTWVGIDVSKKKLDISLYPQLKHSEVSNSVRGFKDLIKILNSYQAELILFESTAGYELPSAYFLTEKLLPVSIINPSRIKSYAKLTGLIVV